MLDRRLLLLTAATVFLVSPEAGAQTRRPFKLERKYKPQRVRFDGYPPGTLVIDVSKRYLYLVEREGRARRYGVGVGRSGLSLKGSAVVGRKAKWPSWRPTDNMIRRNPKKYARYAGGLPGGVRNPLGARALYLYRDGRDTMFRIHGTNEPWSIGQAVSSGCIRMLNEHVKDLYLRVPVGTSVMIL